MSPTASTDKYSSTSRLIHWFMLVLIAATFAFIEFRGIFEKGTDARDLMKLIHFTLGSIVFLLVFARFYFRIRPSNNGAISTTPPLAKYVHLIFYGIMIIMPILGYLTLNAEDKSLIFFGLELPRLISPNESLADFFEESHEVIGTVFYVLIALHVGAALFHHFIKKDQTINKMLP